MIWAIRAPDLDITTTPQHGTTVKSNFKAKHCRFGSIHATTFTSFLCNCSDFSPWWRFMTCADRRFSRVSKGQCSELFIEGRSAYIKKRCWCRDGDWVPPWWSDGAEIGFMVMRRKMKFAMAQILPSVLKVVLEDFILTPPFLRFSYFSQWCSFWGVLRLSSK